MEIECIYDKESTVTLQEIIEKYLITYYEQIMIEQETNSCSM